MMGCAFRGTFAGIFRPHAQIASIGPLKSSEAESGQESRNRRKLSVTSRHESGDNGRLQRGVLGHGPLSSDLNFSMQHSVGRIGPCAVQCDRSKKSGNRLKTADRAGVGPF